jgi:hypothetical protein
VRGTVLPLGGAWAVVAAGQQLPSEIAVDGANLYWIDSVPGGAVMKLAK